MKRLFFVFSFLALFVTAHAESLLYANRVNNYMLVIKVNSDFTLTMTGYLDDNLTIEDTYTFVEVYKNNRVVYKCSLSDGSVLSFMLTGDRSALMLKAGNSFVRMNRVN